MKSSAGSEMIHFNVIYMSTATKSPDNDEFLASEEPGKKYFAFLLHLLIKRFLVFVVKKCRRYTDRDSKAYQNFDDYKQNNNLPKGSMLAPQNGSYVPGDSNGDSNGKVQLVSGEIPAAAPLRRITAVTDTVTMVAGIALSVAGVVTFSSPAMFSLAAMNAIEMGSFALTGYSILK